MLIHSPSGKGDPPNFAYGEFSAVRSVLCYVAYITKLARLPFSALLWGPTRGENR